MKLKKTVIVIIVCGILVALVGVAIKNKPDTQSHIVGDPNGMKVDVDQVSKGDIQTKISTSGKLKAINKKTIYLETPNRVVTLNKKVGDHVEAGEVILVLDQETKVKTERQIDTLKAQLAAAQEKLSDLTRVASKQEILAAQATLAAAQNSKNDSENKLKDEEANLKTYEQDLSDKQRDLALQDELLKEGLTSQIERDDLATAAMKLQTQIDQCKNNIASFKSAIAASEAEIEKDQYNISVLLKQVADPTKDQEIATAQSEITNLQNQISNNQIDLDKETTQIVAPISGVITVIPEDEGAAVEAGVPLVTIVDPTELETECDVSPYYAPDLRLGLETEVKYTGSKTIEVAGEITKVAAVAETRTSTSGDTTVLPITVKVKEDNEVLRPGFSVDVKVVTDTRENVCIIPLLATIEDDDLSYVYVVKEDGSLEKREITEGLSDNLNIEVEGVQEGEWVITNPGDYLTEDTRVFYEKTGDAQ